MRPAGIVLIAIYHFLAAPSGHAVGDRASRLAAACWAPCSAQAPAWPVLVWLGSGVGFLGAAFMFVFAVVAALAGYGVWTFASGDAFCASCWPSFSYCYRLPGWSLMGLHFGLCVGGFHLVRTAINVLIIWYLVQPQMKALFQTRAPHCADRRRENAGGDSTLVGSLP